MLEQLRDGALVTGKSSSAAAHYANCRLSPILRTDTRAHRVTQLPTTVLQSTFWQLQLPNPTLASSASGDHTHLVHSISRAAIHLIHCVGPSGACIAGVLLLGLAHLRRPLQITRLGLGIVGPSLIFERSIAPVSVDAHRHIFSYAGAAAGRHRYAADVQRPN